jgi:hypothetical protein
LVAIIIGLINRQCPKYKHIISTINKLARHKLYCKVVNIHYLNQQNNVYFTIQTQANTYKDNKFTVEQWVHNFIVTDPAINNTSLTTTGNTSLILAEELSYITPIK